jgi:hypothetical protein
MKNKIFALLLISFFYCVTVSGQNSRQKADPVGKWKFEAPYAPEGYTSGIVEVAFAEKQYSTSMTFTGSDYKLVGEKVKFENESLSFTIYVENEGVAISLKMEDGAKMSGKAVYSEGEIPLALTKTVEKK